MTTLITGGAGFIGGHLRAALEKNRQTEQFFSIVRGPSDLFLKEYISGAWVAIDGSDSISSLVQNWEFDTVFHLGGNARPSSPADVLFRDNVQFTFDLIRACPNSHFVFASSSTVYGDTLLSHSEWDALHPTSYYGASKLAAETYVRAAHKLGDIRATILRLCANVGPGTDKGILPDLVRKCKGPDPIVLFGDQPGSIKPYVHVGDTVRAFLHFADHPSDDLRIINVCPEDNLSAERLCHNVQRHLGNYRDIQWAGEASVTRGDNRFVMMSNEAMHRYGFSLEYKTSWCAINQALKEMLS